ncbi:MAG: serpin family protein [Eubacteriales bacterium]|nr:serpin family protein [Eubacteriales bacterium]
MKRYLVLILVLLFTITMFAGCEELNTKTDETTDPEIENPDNGAESTNETTDNDEALKAAELEIEETVLFDALPEQDASSFFAALDLIAKSSLKFAEDTLAGAPNLADKNFVYSPISTWLCYELFLGGITGELAEELQSKLEPNKFNADDKLDNIARFVDYYAAKEHSARTHNLLLITDKMDFMPEYLEYAANFRPLLYRMDMNRTNEVTAAINKLIDEKTAGLIPEFYEDDLDEEIVSILMNITTLDARWKTEFQPEFTEEEEFHKADGSTVTVKMMNQTVSRSMSYAEDEYAQYLIKPYLGNIEMYLILPKESVTPEEALHHFQKNLDKFEFEEYTVELKLPKFTIESDYDLKELLSKMGLEKLFSPDYANQMNRLVNGIDLFIDASRQAAKIEVFEEGTKAAAVTDIAVMEASMAPVEDFIALHFNRPFAFSIIEGLGICLFEGVVMDPTE